MEEEFFFPQNVKTTYRLLGMGPRHLRRVVAGLALDLVVSGLLAYWWSVLWAVVSGAVWMAIFVAGCCWPTNGENTMFDLILHIHRMRRSQMIYMREEVVPAAESPSLAEVVDQYR